MASCYILQDQLCLRYANIYIDDRNQILLRRCLTISKYSMGERFSGRIIVRKENKRIKAIFRLPIALSLSTLALSCSWRIYFSQKMWPSTGPPRAHGTRNIGPHSTKIHLHSLRLALGWNSNNGSDDLFVIIPVAWCCDVWMPGRWLPMASHQHLGWDNRFDWERWLSFQKRCSWLWALSAGCPGSSSLVRLSHEFSVSIEGWKVSGGNNWRSGQQLGARKSSGNCY